VFWIYFFCLAHPTFFPSTHIPTFSFLSFHAPFPAPPFLSPFFFVVIVRFLGFTGSLFAPFSLMTNLYCEAFRAYGSMPDHKKWKKL